MDLKELKKQNQKVLDEGNAIIREYIGEKSFKKLCFQTYGNIDLSACVPIFDHDWNWLMFAVEDIAKHENINVSISSVGMWACFISRDDIFDKSIADMGGYVPIMNVWYAVVGFCKWYKNHVADEYKHS